MFDGSIRQRPVTDGASPTHLLPPLRPAGPTSPQEPRVTRIEDKNLPLQRGDLGEFDNEGRLKIVGRAKEQFKSGKGKYVAPAPNIVEKHDAGHFERWSKVRAEVVWHDA